MICPSSKSFESSGPRYAPRQIGYEKKCAQQLHRYAIRVSESKHLE